MKPTQHEVKSHNLRTHTNLAALALALGLLVALFVPSSASAQFVRPFLRQITGTCANAGETPPSCAGFAPFGDEAPTGVAIDSAGEIWVAEKSTLDEYSPAGAFQGALTLTPTIITNELAVNASSDAFYVNGSIGGAHQQVGIYSHAGVQESTFEIESEIISGIALDKSAGPTAGTVYVASSRSTSAAAIYKLNAAGEPVNFAGCPTCSGYVSGNRITGAPGGNELHMDAAGDLAVDPADGDIYVATQGPFEVGPGETGPAIVKYAPSGEFIRAILAPTSNFSVRGLAVDPTNGDLLASLVSDTSTNGAVDEFDSAGHFLGQITEAAGQPLHRAEASALDSQGRLYVVDRTFSSSNVSQVHAVDLFGAGHFVPALHIAAASARRPESAVLNGAVNAEAETNPEHAGLTDCHFEYVTEAAFEATGFSDLSSGGEASCEPSAGSIPADQSFHPVHASVAGLASGQTYRYRLSGTLGGVLGGESETTKALAFTAPHAPLVESTSVTNLSSTFADLRATINPLGAPTSYQFEYLTEAEYAANGDSFEGENIPATVPATPAEIGAGAPTGSASEAVLQHLSGLIPETSYRCRVVATNELEEEGALVYGPEGTFGPTRSFTTLPQVAPGAGHRVYEQVTPSEKLGGSDMFAEPFANLEYFNAHDVGAPAESGTAFVFQTFSPFGEFPFASSQAYVFQRHPEEGRWSSSSLASPALGPQVFKSAVYDSADLSQLAVNESAGSAVGAEGARNTNLVGPPGAPSLCPPGTGLAGALSGNCSIELKQESALHEVDAENHAPNTTVAGGSRDLSHLILESRAVKGEPEACAGAGAVTHGHVLCEWSGGYETLPGGEQKPELRLVNQFEGEAISKCGAVLGSAAAEEGGSTYRAVSRDGSRVLFTAPDPGAHFFGTPKEKEALEGKEGCWNRGEEEKGKKPKNAPQIYDRVDGSTTLELSAPQPGVTESGHSPILYLATLAGASEDGSRVFFFSEGWLTADHPAGHDAELYEWRADGVTGPMGPCEESSSDYVPSAGGCLSRVSGGESTSVGGDARGVAAVAGNGSAVYFLANGTLAANPGADGTSASPGHCGVLFSPSGGGTCNLYRYETATGVDTYIATVNEYAFSQDGLHFTTPHPTAPWYATPNGRYLLFRSNQSLTGYETAQSSCYIAVSGGDNHGPCAELYRYDAKTAGLVCVSCDPSGTAPVSNASFARSAPTADSSGPVRAMSDDGSYVFFDTADALVPNDTNGTLDTYEWHNGRLSLIGSGTDPAPSFFLGYAPYEYTEAGETKRVEGGNVFIGTHARLAATDSDSLGDIYDARLCEPGSPCIEPPPSREGLCEGDACSHPVPAPDDPTPGSLSYAGPGNERKAPARKACAKGKVRKGGKCVKKRHKQKGRRRSHGRASANRGGAR